MLRSQVRLTEPHARRRAKRLLRRFLELGQRCGVDLLPHHFYSQIPTIHELRTTQRWRQPSSMIGIKGVGLEEQLRFVRDCCQPALMESLLERDVYAESCRANGAPGFGPIESAVLYCFMAQAKPRRIVQVGCGVATTVMVRAAADFGFASDILCIDPYPTTHLREADEQGLIRLRAERAQDVELAAITNLGSGDMLFIDSTHTVKAGSEVNWLVLEVLPRLAPGVVVHYHDIFFPYDYTPGILTTDLFFWSESTLVHAFLIDNGRYRVLAALSMLHYWAQDQLRALLPMYRPAKHEHGYSWSWPASGDSPAGHFPSSMYLCVLPGDAARDYPLGPDRESWVSP